MIDCENSLNKVSFYSSDNHAASAVLETSRRVNIVDSLPRHFRKAVLGRGGIFKFASFNS